MHGRLIRRRKKDGSDAVEYIVALGDTHKAIDLIRGKVADQDDLVEDIGPVSNALLKVLRLGAGEFIRTDNSRAFDDRR